MLGKIAIFLAFIAVATAVFYWNFSARSFDARLWSAMALIALGMVQHHVPGPIAMLQECLRKSS